MPITRAIVLGPVLRSVFAPVFVLAALLAAEAAAQQPLGDGWQRVYRQGFHIDVLDELVAGGLQDAARAEGACFGYTTARPTIAGVAFTINSFDAACWGGTPFSVALGTDGGVPSELTYQVDRADLGVASGYIGTDEARIFYNACRRRGPAFECFYLSYPTEVRGLIDPALGRIVASLKD